MYHNGTMLSPQNPRLPTSKVPIKKIPILVDTYKSWVSTQTFFHKKIQYQVSCCFIGYQNKVEKRSGKCTKNKLDSYIKKDSYI